MTTESQEIALSLSDFMRNIITTKINGKPDTIKNIFFTKFMNMPGVDQVLRQLKSHSKFIPVRSLIIYAAENGKTDILQALLEIPEASRIEYDLYFNTFCSSLKKNHIECALILLTIPKFRDCAHREQNALLFLAIHFSAVPVVRELLQIPEVRNSAARDNNLLLQKALFEIGSPEIISALLEVPAISRHPSAHYFINDPNHCHDLMNKYIEKGHIEAALEMIRSGRIGLSTLSVVDYINLAARHGHLVIAQELIQITRISEELIRVVVRPLHQKIIRSGSFETLKWAITYYKDNAIHYLQDEFKQLFLHAASNKHIQIAEWLLRQPEMNPLLEQFPGEILDYAIRYLSIEVIRELLHNSYIFALIHDNDDIYTTYTLPNSICTRIDIFEELLNIPSIYNCFSTRLNLLTPYNVITHYLFKKEDTTLLELLKIYLNIPEIANRTTMSELLEYTAHEDIFIQIVMHSTAFINKIPEATEADIRAMIQIPEILNMIIENRFYSGMNTIIATITTTYNTIRHSTLSEVTELLQQQDLFPQWFINETIRLRTAEAEINTGNESAVWELLGCKFLINQYQQMANQLLTGMLMTSAMFATASTEQNIARYFIIAALMINDKNSLEFKFAWEKLNHPDDEPNLQELFNIKYTLENNLMKIILEDPEEMEHSYQTILKMF